VPIVENYMPTDNPNVFDRTSNVGVVAGCPMWVWSFSELMANVAMALLAHSGHSLRCNECPLSGVKRTCRARV
jgi:hypothetical protein